MDGRRGGGKGPYFVYILQGSPRTRFKRPFKIGEAYYTRNKNGRGTDAVARARGQKQGEGPGQGQGDRGPGARRTGRGQGTIAYGIS